MISRYTRHRSLSYQPMFGNSILFHKNKRPPVPHRPLIISGRHDSQQHNTGFRKTSDAQHQIGIY